MRVIWFPRCRLTEERGGCYTSIGLPLIENTSIVEQPLNPWTLTDKYKSAATGIIKNARCNTAAEESVVSTGCNNNNKERQQQAIWQKCTFASLSTADPWRIFVSTNCHISLSQEARTALFPLHGAGSHARSTGPSPSCSPSGRWQRRVRRQLAGDGRPDWGGEKCVWRNRQGQHTHLVHRLVTLTTVICLRNETSLSLFSPHLLHYLGRLWPNTRLCKCKIFDVMIAAFSSTPASFWP